MRQILVSLTLFALALLASPRLQATHYMGADLTYECLPPDPAFPGCVIYRIYMSVYYDCAGAATTPLPGPAPDPFLSFTSVPGGCPQPVAVQNSGWVAVSYQEVTPVCPGFVTRCSSSSAALNGVSEQRHYRDYRFCNAGANCVYTASFESCCRNSGITSGAGDDGIYVSTTIKPSLTPCNSSPRFTSIPVPYICAGQPYTFNQGAFDANGDSLSYSLVPCAQSINSTVTYNANFSPLQPLGPTWNVSIDPLTGDITMLPNTIGSPLTAVLCVKVNEYRNGLLIGSVTRDIQVTAIVCTGTNMLPAVGQVLNETGCVKDPNNAYKVIATACQPMSFTTQMADTNASQAFKYMWSKSLASKGATFTSTGLTPTQIDTIQTTGNPPNALFSWTPPTCGTYTFTVTARDNNCPIFGANQRTFVIVVLPGSLQVTTKVDSNCYCVNFFANPCGFGTCGGNQILKFNWSGDAAISSSGNQGANGKQSFTHCFPGPGSYNYQCIMEVPATGFKDTFTSVLTLTNTAIANAGGPYTVCAGLTQQIGTPALPGYTYSWFNADLGGGSSFGLLGATNVAQPNVSLNNLGTIDYDYLLTATDSNGCDTTDLANVTFAVAPNPTFNLPANACIGANVPITYTNAQNVGMTYNWNLGGGTAVVPGDATIVGQWNTPGPKTVTLELSDKGCQKTGIKTIQINPIPTANFISPGGVCVNAPLAFSYVGTGGPNTTFLWSFDGGVATGANTATPQVTWSTSGPKTVSLTVIDLGCQSAQAFTQVIQVNPIPVANFNLQPQVCMNDSVTITATSSADTTATYLWSFDGAIPYTNSGVMGPHTVVWPSSGTKHIGLQVIENGCVSDTVFQDIIVSPDPEAFVNPVADQCLLGNSFTFGHGAVSNGMDSYAWTFDADANPVVSAAENPTGVTFNAVGMKMAILQVTKNGCVSTPDTAYFTVKQMPDAQFTVSGGVHPGIICAGAPINVSPSAAPLGPGQFYNWTFGSGSLPSSATQVNPGAVNYISSGSKTIMLTTTYLGCSSTSSETITVNPGLSVSAGPDIAFCEGLTGVATASASGGTPHGTGSPYSYVWTSTIGAVNMGISDPNSESPTLNPLVTPTAPLGLAQVPYIVYAVDGTGCESNRDTMMVTVYARPRVHAGGNRWFCATGPGAYLNGGLAASNVAVGPISYYWSPGDGMLDSTALNVYAKPAQTTIYTLVGTSPQGCVSNVLDTAATTIVTRRPNPMPFAGRDTAVCFGQSTVLYAYNTGGGNNTSTLSYSWSPAGTVVPATGTGVGITPPTVTPQITTEYILTVVADGCEGTDTVVVTVNPLPQLTVSSDSNAVCYGASAMLTAKSAGNSVVWTDPYNTLSSKTVLKPKATFNVPPGVTTVTYTVTATTPAGCVSPSAITLPIKVLPTPVPFIGQKDTTVCANSEVKLPSVYKWLPVFPTTQQNAMIRWYKGNVQIDSLNPGVTVAPATSTTYSVKTDRLGCAASASVTITVVPGLNLIARADTNLICAGDELKLIIHEDSVGFGDTRYVWSASNPANAGISNPTLSSPIVKPTQSMEYYVTAREGICVERDTVSVTVKKRPVPTYYASQTTGCAGVEVTFLQNAQDAIAYVWEFGDGTPLSNKSQVVHQYTTPGVYTANFTAIAEGGCRASGEPVQIVITGGATADFSSLPSVAGEPIALDNSGVRFQDQSVLTPNGAPIAGYFWDFGDGTTSNDANPVHIFADSGQFTVKLVVTDADGCISEKAYGPYRVFTPQAGIQNVITPNGDGKNDVFRVAYNGSEKVSFTIFDRWGRLVFEGKQLTDVWTGRMADGTEAPVGVYFYIIHIGEKTLKGDITLIR